jgi:aldehyde:ferredoxin oxidoreductase
MASRFKGYTGRALDIDLTTGKIGEYDISDKDRELFLGGRYLSTKILWDELKPGIDPLSPENVIVIMTGPLTGTGAPSSSRYDISAKSPLTGAIGHSNSGGHFGLHMKRAGWDAMVIRGKAEKPVYIDIDNEKVEIKDAAHLWGKNTQDSQALMGKAGGKVVIGPAGENLVKYATAVSQERSHGRCGMGAVMGSKNLKGLVAKGTRKLEVAEPDKLKAVYRKWVSMLQAHPATGDMAPRYGTANFLTALSAGNALPTKNFSTGTYEHAERIGGKRLAEEKLIKNYGCVTCPIRCGRVVELDGHEVKGPEYEILCLLGSNMLIDDMDAIIRWNYELDLLGIDSISVGTVMGFAAELNEKGMWDSGVEFGKADNISQVLEDIAYRRGVGSELAEGVKWLSEKYGGKDFAPHAKGLEMAAYEPRGSVGHGLGYATASRGACHLDGGYVIYFEVTGPVLLDQYHWRSKPGWVVLDQNLMAAISAGGQCLFTSWTFVPPIAFKVPQYRLLSKIVSKILTYAWPSIDATLMLPPSLMKINLPMLPHSKAIKMATGMDMNFGKFLAVGARGYNLERMFNLREGFSKKDDTLPRRFTSEPQIADKPESIVRIDDMLPKYYWLRGWDKNGVPTKKTLNKLGLDFIK